MPFVGLIRALGSQGKAPLEMGAPGEYRSHSRELPPRSRSHWSHEPGWILKWQLRRAVGGCVWTRVSVSNARGPRSCRGGARARTFSLIPQGAPLKEPRKPPSRLRQAEGKTNRVKQPQSSRAARPCSAGGASICPPGPCGEDGRLTGSTPSGLAGPPRSARTGAGHEGRARGFAEI